MDENPYLLLFQDITCDISPKDFEIYCCRILEAYAEKEHLSECSVEHNVELEAHDGKYQIDVLMRFKVAGMAFTTIVECKRYKRPVERKVVAELHSKINSLGFQKGMIISTSGFQSGAIEYAVKHGIALVQVFDKCWRSYSESAERESDRRTRQKILFDNLPNYCAVEWTDVSSPCYDLIPTSKDIQEAHRKTSEQMKNLKKEQENQNA